MNRQSFYIATLVVLGALVLSACGGSAGKATATPTLSIEELSTLVAQTVIAQITENAPTITPIPTTTDTPEFSPTVSTPLPTNTPIPPTPGGCANLAYISDVTIPDGTTLAVGQEFTKTWRVQNSGTCTWTTSFKLVFSYGEAMSGKAVAVPAAVAAGQQIDLSVVLKVPNKTGTLSGYWRMFDDKNQPFGKILTVVINVGAASPTPTTTSTMTPTLENTAAPTETPSPTP